MFTILRKNKLRLTDTEVRQTYAAMHVEESYMCLLKMVIDLLCMYML